MKNSSIRFYCDNMAIVEIINKQSSKDGKLMNIVRPLVLKMLEFNIHFVAVHIPGVRNVLAIAISRFQNTEKLLQAYSMKSEPTAIVDQILPRNLIL